MTETISKGNVEALRSFFVQHFESMKTNTQPRNKSQKNYKNFAKSSVLNLSTSRQDVRKLDMPSISRSLSVFDLPNVKVPAFCKNQKMTNKSNEELIKSREIGLDTLSNDSGVEENYDSSPLGDSRQSSVFKNRLCSESCSSDGETETKAPTVNIIIKPSLIENEDLPGRKDKQRNVMTVWNRTYEVDINQEIEKSLSSSPQKMFYSEVFINNNYVCKAQYKRTKLPPLEIIGPPPSKPVKPSNIIVPFPLMIKCMAHKPLISKKPSRLSPLPPLPNANKIEPISTTTTTTSIEDVSNYSNGYDNIKTHKSFWKDNENIENIGNESEIGVNVSPPTLPPKKFSYHLRQMKNWKDNENIENIGNESEIGVNVSPPTLPPKKFSYHLMQTENAYVSDTLLEELYQDTQINDDKIYEEMPFSNYEFQVYSKERKRSKSQRELQKEQKEQERRERELDKGRRKFGLTGDEIPLEKGSVKNDRRGSQSDLTVKKGEAVLILRMENNPVGRWLVKNDKGKIGYVELDNIRMDANSIKTVMKERRASMGSKDGRTYSVSSVEAVYEEAC